MQIPYSLHRGGNSTSMAPLPPSIFSNRQHSLALQAVWELHASAGQYLVNMPLVLLCKKYKPPVHLDALQLLPHNMLWLK